MVSAWLLAGAPAGAMAPSRGMSMWEDWRAALFRKLDEQIQAPFASKEAVSLLDDDVFASQYLNKRMHRFQEWCDATEKVTDE